MKTFFIMMVMIGSVQAATSEEVLIRGKIGNSFDENSISVIDSFGQTYRIPRKLFPKNFSPKQGKSFAIEISEDQVKKLKVTQPL